MYLRDAGVAAAINPPPPQFLADYLTLIQLGRVDYAHHITTAPPPDFWTVRRLFTLVPNHHQLDYGTFSTVGQNYLIFWYFLYFVDMGQ